MIRLSRRTGGVLAAMLLACLLLLVGWVDGGPAAPGASTGRLPSLVGGVLPVSAAMTCPTPATGDVFQGPDDRIYLYRDGSLHAIPDLETLRALGFDPNGVDPIRDECLRSMRFGEPVPSVGTGSQPGRSAASPDPTAPRDPAAPALLLEVSDARPARRSTVRLTAHADTPSGSGLVLSIHRTADDGRPGASGLVTTCSDTPTCAVEVWEDEALTWIFVATLYRCDAAGACIAVQEAIPVRVTWQ